MRPVLRRLALASTALTIAALTAATGIIASDDPLSRTLRPPVQSALQATLDGLRDRFAEGQATACDRAVLRLGIHAGAALTSWRYPEGATILRHAAADDPIPMVLDASWFSQDPYVAQLVERLGPGVHGPVGVRVDDDLRLALALNPILLTALRSERRNNLETQRR